MRKSKLFMCLLAAVGTAVGSAHAEKVKQLLFLQDDAQLSMVSKVYELKHVMAADLTPWVEGAVKRYSANSAVGRLNYSPGKQQFLVVSCPSAMMKYVDDMIKTLDYPCDVKDNRGSVVAGTGIYRFAYMPKYRKGEWIQTLLELVRSSDGNTYYNADSNMIYWQDSKSDGSSVMEWAKKLDHPVPQVELELKVYEVRDSTLNDVGIDYLAWKNGPGLDFFSVGLEDLALKSTEFALANIDQFSSFTYGGMFVAPQFDMSFVRMLSQKGDAKIAATGSVTLVNDTEGTNTYDVTFQPTLQNITKELEDEDSKDQSKVVGSSNYNYKMTVVMPIICFQKSGEADKQFEGNGFDYTTYSSLSGTLQFKYTLINQDVVERNNGGTELTDTLGTDGDAVESRLTIQLGSEKLLAVYSQKQKVEQVIGIPFLCKIPYLKYLFSTTTSIDADTKVFVTVKARLVHPEDSFSEWSGKLLSEKDFK